MVTDINQYTISTDCNECADLAGMGASCNYNSDCDFNLKCCRNSSSGDCWDNVDFRNTCGIWCQHDYSCSDSYFSPPYEIFITDDTHCLFGICSHGSDIGGPCDSNNDCIDDLICLPNQTCSEKSDIGESCDDDSDCLYNLHCCRTSYDGECWNNSETQFTCGLWCDNESDCFNANFLPP